MAQHDDDTGTAISHYLKSTPSEQLLPALGNLAQIWVSLDQTNTLLALLDDYRQRYPELSERLFLFEAELHQRLDDPEQAATVLRVAKESLPESVNLLYASSMALERVGDYDAAVAELRTVVAIEPSNPTALNALGYVLTNRSTKYQEALELITQAHTLRPDDPVIIDSLGWVNFRLGNFELALEYLQQAYALNDDPEIAAHLGELLWELSLSAKALEVWQNSLRKYPKNKHILETVKRLGAQIEQILEAADNSNASR